MGGLFLKLADLVVVVHVHDAEPAGFIHGHLQHGDGNVCPSLLVVLQHFGIIHLINVVAGEDEDVLGVIQVDEPDVLIDGVGRPLIPGARVTGGDVGGQHMDAAIGAV